ncbi:DUF6463 family protein [Myceligenerans crystallogenes]|uniref:Uncharacterized protein n=1 Tax=Myceligenerans crystallogenes TaxID=316335 RepID=A0ABN2NFH1_9MICO
MNTPGNRLVIWGGAIVTLCGIGHSVGALIQVAPTHAAAWLGGVLWEPVNQNYLAFTPAMGALWYTHYSFGLPLLLLGAMFLTLGLRGMAPPRLITAALMLWAVIGEIASGLSPLILLVPAGILLLLGASRPREVAIRA